MPTPNDATPPPPLTRVEKLAGPTLWIAVAVLVAWAAFVVFLVGRTSTETTSEIEWTRLAWLFSSVEAVVFGAAGALFGTSIQRQRAERAEQRADANAKDASNGRALAGALLADEGAGEEEADEAGSGTRTRGSPFDRATDRGAGAGLARRHARLARTLFPNAG